MVCQECGKEMVKVGELTDQEKQDFWFINEKINCAYQAIDSEVVKNMEFTDGQVFEYFRAAYDAQAQAKFLQFIFFRDLRKRLGIWDKDLNIDEISTEIFIHPEEVKKEA